MTIQAGLKRLMVVVLAAFITACSAPGEYRDEHDPWEGFNRGMTSFNDNLDKAILKPLAQGYQAITPSFVDKAVTNFFSNLDDVVVAINNLLQFKLNQAGSDVGRILINSTIGVLGFVDVASDMGFEKHNEDFGQTLGAWGVGDGPYLVLPFLGPSSTRDAFGLFTDMSLFDPIPHVDHVPTRNTLTAMEIIDLRADNLNNTKVLEQAAIDPYVFVRDAYLQRRQDLVFDGNPPLEDDFLDDPIAP